MEGPWSIRRVSVPRLPVQAVFLAGGGGDGSCPPGGSTRPGRALEAGPVTSVCRT